LISQVNVPPGRGWEVAGNVAKAKAAATAHAAKKCGMARV